MDSKLVSNNNTCSSTVISTSLIPSAVQVIFHDNLLLDMGLLMPSTY
jgi:hypothetical protein